MWSKHFCSCLLSLYLSELQRIPDTKRQLHEPITNTNKLNDNIKYSLDPGLVPNLSPNGLQSRQLFPRDGERGWIRRNCILCYLHDSPW